MHVPLGNPERLQQRLRREVGSGGAVQSWAELYAAAEAAYPAFHSLLTDVVAAAGGVASVRIIFPPDSHKFKGRERAAQKARDDYSDRSPGPAFGWLFDIARAALVCETAEVVKRVLAVLVADPSKSSS